MASKGGNRTPLLTAVPVAVQHIPPGKLFCIIRERLVKETPEEQPEPNGDLTEPS